MTRKEMDKSVRDLSLQKKVIELTGKCYSRCSKEELETALDAIRRVNYAGEDSTAVVVSNKEEKLTAFKLFVRWLKYRMGFCGRP